MASGNTTGHVKQKFWAGMSNMLQSMWKHLKNIITRDARYELNTWNR